MSDWAAKRFWTKASAVEVEGGFTVHLDARTVKTPAKADFITPSLAMAEAAALEWDAQEKVIDPTTMPVTRAVNAAIDKVTIQFQEVADMLAAYGDADLICYRAAMPENLVKRQNEVWTPLIDWAAEKYGARLTPVVGVMHAPQSADALERLSAPLYQMSAFELTAMHDLISMSGSLVMGLAASEGAFAIDELWTASRLDELWQIEQWGFDEDAEAQSAIKRQAFFDAAQFLAFSRA